MSTERLVYGKAEQKGVVSVEVGDGQAELFIQDEDGSVRSEFVQHKYWLLSNRQLDKNWIRLKGDLHYKWGRQFENRADWQKFKNIHSRDDVYTIHDAKENFLVNKGYTYNKGLKPTDVSILSFDIETTGFSGTNDKLLLISNTWRQSNGEVNHALFAFDEYDSEGDMLADWIKFVNDADPSVICGHNIYGFDLPFLRDVADREGIQLEIGRDGSPIKFSNFTSEKRKDGSQSISYNKVRCYGRELIDTMFLAITYDAVAKKYESYALKKIIEHEGIRFEGRQMYDAGLIRENYQNPEEWEKIKLYCVHDSDEALALYDLMIPATFYLTSYIPKSFQAMVESATGSQINALLVRSYLQEAHSVPKKTELIDHVEGGISFGIPGIYRNVLKLDIKSAYPSQILRFKLFDKRKDPQGNFYNAVKYFAEQRFEYKRLNKETGDRKYIDLDASAKVFINSAYGVTNTNGLNFNSPELAAKITGETRTVICDAIELMTSQPLEYWFVKDEEEDDAQLSDQ